MGERFYFFELSGGTGCTMSLREARERASDPAIAARITQIIQSSTTKKMKKDGFEPGWQENIQAYAGGRLEYNQMLKERGLVEIGRDYIPGTEKVEEYNPLANAGFVEECKRVGVELSDNEADAIVSGDYFKE